MRKRAQLRSKPVFEEPKHIVQQMKPRTEERPSKFKKNWWIAFSLIAIFLLLLFLNTYFNLTSGVAYNPEGTGLEKFYLSGPDPYYNMRLVEGTFETGIYPYYSEADPLLQYPLGAYGGRAPLFNMAALGFSRLLTPFMSEVDAIGYSMQFIPALFGALLIFPVYLIGKELFNRKAGLIGAMFLAMIPIHLGSGHGSAYALFDHDSFNLLLFFITFLFLIKAIKEKNPVKSAAYAVLSGVPLAALTMTWVEARYLYVIIAIYAIVQMFIDIFTDKIEPRVFRTTSIVLFSGYFISIPLIMTTGEFSLNTALFLCLVVAGFGFVYYLFGKMKIPWTLSIPSVIGLGAGGLAFLYFVRFIDSSIAFLAPIKSLGGIIFGAGIYGSKVSMTIAEANTYEISHTVMSFGPAIYWLGWAGLVYLIFLYYKNKLRREYLFIATLFILNIYLASTAGRFLNDMVPLIAILSGWIVWIFVDWIDYKQMFRNIRSAGGGIHGIRRGIKFLHVFGILFIAFLVVLPNAFIAFDAAVPNALTKNSTSILKVDMFGEDHRGAFGLGVGKERYWADAFDWLSDQDTDIEDPVDRPAFISWWDYGFYEVALGGHPTVADNFQDGIEPASNFHTSTSEREAVVIWIVRLMEGNLAFNNRKLTDDVVQILNTRLGENVSEKVQTWVESPNKSPSYNQPIGAEYDENTSQDYRVGQQYSRNAVYHDVVDLLTNETEGFTDEELTWLYHDIQEATGYSIRYYGVEGYDRQIFNIFGFLADKSLLLVNGMEDDFIELLYEGYRVDTQGNRIPDSNFAMPASEILGMSGEDRKYTIVTGTSQRYKDLYFDTMFYRTYIGPPKGEPGNYEEFDWQVPCNNMKHFYAEFISDLNKFPYYGTQKGAVVIAKYYEGAYVNGTVTFNGNPIESQVVVQKNLTYTEGATFPIDHDADDVDIIGENATGEFSVIAGAGNIILQIRKHPELGQNAFILKEIIFNSTTDPELSEITDDDAMRRENSNYERFLNITIEPANVEGYVYIDKDDDGSYNASIDEPLTDVIIEVSEITDPVGGELPIVVFVVNVDENGYYNATGLLPGFYRITAVDSDNFILHLKDFVSLFSGNNSYDIAKPKDAAIEGNVYYDNNQDDEFNAGDDKMSDITVELLYKEKQIDNTITDSEGKYSFTNLIAGKFTGDDRGFNEYTIIASSPPDYHTEVIIAPEENMTTSFNISLKLTPITVSGFTRKIDGTAVGGITLDFEVDESVTDNTAGESSTITDENGAYTISLTPGNYNVTGMKDEGSVLVYLLEDGELDLVKGQDPVSNQVFYVLKKSITVSGTTRYENINIDNVTINFVNINAGLSASAITDETGQYSLELSPGTYDVTARSEEFTEAGTNYTYHFTETLIIDEEEIDAGKTWNIEMDKVVSE